MPRKQRHNSNTDTFNAKRAKTTEPCPVVSTGFFSKKQPLRPLRLRAITAYEYETEDIQAILTLRLQQFKNVTLLAAADMNKYASGNRVADVLKLYFEEGSYYASVGSKQDLIIPIETNDHWVGIRLQLKPGQAAKVSYYNSLLAPKSDMQLMAAIKLEMSNLKIDSPYNFENIKICKYPYCLYQHDKTSCGPLLIENIYRDLEKQTEDRSDPSLEAHIRQEHLTLLKDNNLRYYDNLMKKLVVNSESLKRC